MTMTLAELQMLHAHIDSACHYLEFGSGESTRYAARSPGLVSVDSVESSLPFLQSALLDKPDIQAALASGKLHIHRVDLGETVDWGHPKDDSRRHLWPNYSLAVFDQPRSFDLVLVDGRFRVACAMAALLSTPALARIMIHDFWNRPYYHFLLDHFEVEQRVDTLVVLRKKDGHDAQQALTLLQIYQYLPHDIPPMPPPTRLQRLRGRLSRLLKLQTL